MDTDSASRPPTVARGQITNPSVRTVTKQTATAPAKLWHVEDPAPQQTKNLTKARINELAKSIAEPSGFEPRSAVVADDSLIAPTTPTTKNTTQGNGAPLKVHFNRSPSWPQSVAREVPHPHLLDENDFDPGELGSTGASKHLESIFDDDDDDELPSFPTEDNRTSGAGPALDEFNALRLADEDLIHDATQVDKVQSKHRVEELDAFLLDEAARLAAPQIVSPENVDIHRLVWSLNRDRYHELRDEYRRLWEEIVDAGDRYKRLVQRVLKLPVTQDVYEQSAAVDRNAALRVYNSYLEHFYLTSKDMPELTIQDKVSRWELKLSARSYVYECWRAIVDHKPSPPIPDILRNASGFDPRPRKYDWVKAAVEAMDKGNPEHDEDDAHGNKSADEDEEFDIDEEDEVVLSEEEGDEGDEDDDEDDNHTDGREQEESASKRGRLTKDELKKLEEWRSSIIAEAKLHGRNPHEYLARVGGHDLSAPRGLNHYNAWKAHWASENPKTMEGNLFSVSTIID